MNAPSPVAAAQPGTTCSRNDEHLVFVSRKGFIPHCCKDEEDSNCTCSGKGSSEKINILSSQFLQLSLFDSSGRGPHYSFHVPPIFCHHYFHYISFPSRLLRYIPCANHRTSFLPLKTSSHHPSLSPPKDSHSHLPRHRHRRWSSLVHIVPLHQNMQHYSFLEDFFFPPVSAGGALGAGAGPPLMGPNGKGPPKNDPPA